MTHGRPYYCEAIKTDTSWSPQEPTTKPFELSAQDFDITHEQFTTRASRQIIPPTGCLHFLLRVAVVSKSAQSA